MSNIHWDWSNREIHQANWSVRGKRRYNNFATCPSRHGALETFRSTFALGLQDSSQSESQARCEDMALGEDKSGVRILIWRRWSSCTRVWGKVFLKFYFSAQFICKLRKIDRFIPPLQELLVKVHLEISLSLLVRLSHSIGKGWSWRNEYRIKGCKTVRKVDSAGIVKRRHEESAIHSSKWIL